jgi:hypothetical protein
MKRPLKIFSKMNFSMRQYRGTRWRSWLRHYAISWKVALSISDEVIGFFNRPNPYSRTMAVGWTQPLTETSTRNLPGVKGSQRVRLTTSPPVLIKLDMYIMPHEDISNGEHHKSNPSLIPTLQLKYLRRNLNIS